jgi:MerR family transcriptional regulator, light-induced transcriptional regulator
MSDAREQIERPRLVNSLPGACGLERAVNYDGRLSSRRKSAAGLSGLTRTIETAVIPSLLAAHSRLRETRSNLSVEQADPASDHAAELAEQMIAGDTEGATARIETLRSRGYSLEDIYIQLLAPAGGHLRHLWGADLCGFAEATLALWRLQQLLRHYSVEFRAETERQETGRRALLAPTPREKHDLSYAMFYLVLLSEFFRRDGWEAWIEPDPNAPEFAELIRKQWFDVVEFLVSGEKQLDALASRIRLIRRESQNRSIGVMVYGQVFIEHPELVVLVGADLTATDARQGALQAQHLLSLTSGS